MMVPGFVSLDREHAIMGWNCLTRASKLYPARYENIQFIRMSVSGKTEHTQVRLIKQVSPWHGKR